MRGNAVALHGQKHLAKEVAALKAQLRKLSDALEAEAHDGVERVADQVQTKSREAIDHAIAAAQSFIDEQAELARDTAKSLARKSSEMRDAAEESLVEQVQAHPLGTLAAIAGIGFLAGYLCRRH
ncbi:MAG: hypothetical protein KIT25_06775 [Enhydrobacter sp.]|nr:MAG: hypothetical protein KIT25_06775 [Enhydrobacter sp.]